MPKTCFAARYFKPLLLLLWLLMPLGGVSSLLAQAVKGAPPAGAQAPPITFSGLLPGVHDGTRVKQVLGEPVFASRWYDYKLYYPAKGADGLFDVVHLHSPAPDSLLANIDAVSVPEGYRSVDAVRQKLGEPEYELVMATWRLLDYSERGLRFAFDASGRAIGVAYFPHGYPRVPAGERRTVDLSALRQGPQPAPASRADLNGMRAGTAQVVLTPLAKHFPEPFRVHDDLKARILVIHRGDLTVGFVGADLFGMSHPEISVLREAARKKGIDHVVFAMSHNHAAPDTIGVYGHYPAEYIGYIQERVVAGLVDAKAGLVPVREIRTASRELPMNGMRVHDLFRNARNPGILDPSLSAVQMMAEDGEVLATLVHFACHVESLSQGAKNIGADFPGVMADTLKAAGAGTVVFLNGAVGGMVSGDNRERTFESSAEMGKQLAALTLDLLANAQATGSGAFSVAEAPIEIPMVNPEFRALYDAGLRELNRGRVKTDMLYVRLGEAQFVTLPGELLPEVSFEILERMKGFPRMLVGLGNDQLGYMIPPYDFREGFYEESMSQGPSTALIVRDTAIRLVEADPAGDW